jgi:hypothetical protein
VKYILRRRPSPALVISCIALFVSMGGVSYGVATGFIDSREIRNNTITSGDVRNNTLRTFDIRNNEVRGFDVRNSSLQGRDIAFNTVTGADINESTLGKVPSATQADSASAIPSLVRFGPATLAKGAAPVTLMTHGPLTLLASCEDDAGSTVATLRVGTTEGASLMGGSDPTGNRGTFLQPGNPVVAASVTDAPASGVAAGSATVFGSTASGKGFTGQAGLFANSDDGGSCRYNGHVVTEG